MPNKLEEVIKKYDSFDYYVKDKIERDTEQNRKGQFALTFVDGEGNKLDGVKVKVKQKSHEFRFGGTTFYLGGYDDAKMNEKFEKKFKNVFNYAVIPLYWDTLEPEKGKPRFEEGCVHIDRRPPLDTAVKFCKDNGMRMKGHCLVYNSFQPDWIPEDNRELKLLIEKRVKAIAERYADDFEDMDVINEMMFIYKNAYPGYASRNLQITDEEDHEKWAFELAKRYFPNTRLFWNEGGYESFSTPYYKGHRSFYYMALKDNIAKGAPIEGIGMQYHCYASPETCDKELETIANPLRLFDVFDKYGEFGLPISISEITVPSWSNDAHDEELQGELVKRLYTLWFSQKPVSSIVWWNLADGSAYKSENKLFGGLIRRDCTPKPAYKAIDELINKKWHTETSAVVDKRFNFRGFYGDYEVEASCGKLKAKTDLRLWSDNTGFDNRLCDFRTKQIILK